MNSNPNFRQIRTVEKTLSFNGKAHTFKEKLEMLRLFGNLGIDVVDLGPVCASDKTTALLCRTAGALLDVCTIRVDAGADKESADAAYAAVSGAAHPRLCVALPVSTVVAEYAYHKKPAAMIDVIGNAVAYAASLCADVEFRAVDALRAEPGILAAAARRAIENGAKTVTVCDTAGEALPGEFAAVVAALRAEAGPDIAIGIECSDNLGLANASALACCADADEVACAFCPGLLSVCEFAGAVQARGKDLGVTLGLDTTSLSHTAERIAKLDGRTHVPAQSGDTADAGGIPADADITAVAAAARELGYELSDDDKAKVYESFRRVCRKSGKSSITSRELEAVVASSAMQVPPTYRLESYVINSGNTISSTAHVILEKGGKTCSGLGLGDGPIDAAFHAVEQIIGHHYELDDFQIQAVTEGQEAMGEALVRLRSDGVLYSGRGISTDIIGSAVRAYISALNKIAYEENTGA